MSSLTLAELQAILDNLFPKLYYGTSDLCPKGEYYIALETDHSPKFIIVHPDDLDKLRSIAYPVQLVHLSQQPLESMANRLKKFIQPSEPEDP